MAQGDFSNPSYQTLPLEAYSPRFRNLASTLFELVRRRTGSDRAVEYDGSFSVLSKPGSQTIAKIVVFEEGKGKVNGRLPGNFIDGVYLLVRTDGAAAARMWSHHGDQLRTVRGLNASSTIGIAPRHTARFAYALVTDQDELERIASVLASLRTGRYRN